MTIKKIGVLPLKIYSFLLTLADRVFETPGLDHNNTLTQSKLNQCIVKEFRTFFKIRFLYRIAVRTMNETYSHSIHFPTRMFAKYYHANSVNYDEYLEYNCTDSCQRTQYCSIVKQRYDEFEDCYRIVSAADKFVSNKFVLSMVVFLFLFRQMM